MARPHVTPTESIATCERTDWLRPELQDDGGRPASELDIVTVLAHDLRNYLTPVYGRLGMIAKRAAADGRDLDVTSAADTLRVLDQMLALVVNVLDLAERQRGITDLTLKPVDLAALVRQLAAVLGQDDRPIVVTAPKWLIARADAQRLRQALHNLLANALHYTPAQSPVELRLTRELRDSGAVAVISVRDHGPGLPAELLPRLFQRFTPGPGSTGLGIGLCVANQIAVAHGGTLTARSVRGRGACFELTLPLDDLSGY